MKKTGYNEQNNPPIRVHYNRVLLYNAIQCDSRVVARLIIMQLMCHVLAKTKMFYTYLITTSCVHEILCYVHFSHFVLFPFNYDNSTFTESQYVTEAPTFHCST